MPKSDELPPRLEECRVAHKAQRGLPHLRGAVSEAGRLCPCRLVDARGELRVEEGAGVSDVARTLEASRDASSRAMGSICPVSVQ